MFSRLPGYQAERTEGWTMRMNTHTHTNLDNLTEVPFYYKHRFFFFLNRTFIINKQAPARPSTHMTEIISEVSAWLLHYVHIAWSDGPLCSIAQTSWTRWETVIGPLIDMMSQVKRGDRLYPCNCGKKKGIPTHWYWHKSTFKVHTRTEHTWKNIQSSNWHNLIYSINSLASIFFFVVAPEVLP